MWQRLLRDTGPGLVVGAVLSVVAAVVRARASGPSTGDTMMGAQVLLDYSAMPLSLLTGRPVRSLLEVSCCGMLSSGLEYAHVMFNWGLLSLLASTLWRAFRKPGVG